MISLETLFLLFVVAIALSFSYHNRAAFIALLFVLTLLLAYHLRAILLPPLIALLLAYILNPLVTWLESRRVPRLASIGTIFAVFLVVFLLVLLVAIPAAVNQGVQFVQETFVGDDETEPKIVKALSTIGVHLEEYTGYEWKSIVERVKASLQEHAADLATFAGGVAALLGMWVATGIGAVFAAFSFVVLIPVYLFFFLRGINSGWEKFKEHLPEAYRDRVLATLGKMHRANASFFRGAVTICLIDGAILFLILWAFGVRFSFFFGLLYALFAIVPFIGPISAFVVTEIFVVANSGFGTPFFVVLVAFVAIQLLETAFLQPMILGKETGLHPVIIIISIFVFGELFGFLGILLAVPLASASLILAQDYLLPAVRSALEEKT